jgi:uncharacterized protein YkwD
MSALSGSPASLGSAFQLCVAHVVAAILLLPGTGLAAWGYSEPKPATIDSGRLTPGRPPVPRYGEDPSLTCPETTMARALKDQLEELARERKKAAAQPEGRLCAVAEALLGWEQKEEPRQPVLTFLSQYFGLPATARRISNVIVPTEDWKTLAGKLFEPISNFSLNAAQPRYGIATRRLGREKTRVVLVLQDMPFSLDPTPRRLAPGEKAALSGRLLGEYHDARIALSDVMGRMTRPTIPAGNSFRTEIACGEKAGRIQVEVAAESAGGPALLARFPVACGTELATSVPVADPEPWPAEPEKQERRMLQDVNAERGAVGLKPLAWDDDVAGVARGVAESMRVSGTVPGDLVERLRKAGVGSELVLQNPAQSRTAADALQDMLASPGHRAAIMSPDVTSAGMGIVPQVEKDGTSSVFVAQLFVKELPRLDPQVVRQQLRDAVVQKRKDARQPAAVFDPQLEQLAQTYAADLAAAGGSLPQARKSELTASLNKSFKTVHVLSGAKAEPLDLAEEPEVVSGGRFAGVGAAAGTHPTLGRNAVYAVILVGSKR